MLVRGYILYSITNCYFNQYDIVGKSIGLIADAVTSRSSKDDTNLLVYLETERLRAEERMRIQMESDKRQAEERERHREEDRRRDDQRFQMQMMMMANLMNPNRQHHHLPFVPLNHTPTTVNSMESREEKCEFDGQDIIEAELIRKTTGV